MSNARASISIVWVVLGATWPGSMGCYQSHGVDRLDASPDGVDVGLDCAPGPELCGMSDAGVMDAGLADGGSADAAVVDAASIDAGAPNCIDDPLLCDDGDPCTQDVCDPATGCVFRPTDCQGCADGSRDAYLDLDRYSRIAACAGGFAIAGLSRGFTPTCRRGSGDDGPNPNGVGCSAADLCAPGWHVCASVADVASHSPDGCVGAADAAPRSFFATRQTGPGCGACSTGTDMSCNNSSCRDGCAQTARTTNDFFGCGNLGSEPGGGCGVLNRSSNNLCDAVGPPWRCDDDLRESQVVVKLGPDGGGVLCCED